MGREEEEVESFIGGGAQLSRACPWDRRPDVKAGGQGQRKEW